MATKGFRVGFAFVLLMSCGCARKPLQVPLPPALPAPPPPKENLVVLLPDPEGTSSSISVANAAGAQTLSQPYQAVRVERPDSAPTPPFPMEQAEVRRRFGAVLDALPAKEITFTLYFTLNSDALLPESTAQIPAILDAIRERRSTAITVIGHTDTTATPQFNYALGLRRAQGVADTLNARGVDSSILIVTSHGQSDLAVKTGNGVPESLNRRVEVIVR
jgi:outer membrane protein OmpA-like peptidoglycan-associated protein